MQMYSIENWKVVCLDTCRDQTALEVSSGLHWQEDRGILSSLALLGEID